MPLPLRAARSRRPTVFCCALQSFELRNEPPPRRRRASRVLRAPCRDRCRGCADPHGRVRRGRARRIGIEHRYCLRSAGIVDACRAQSSATIRDVSCTVRKAVFPAAGLGTRFLPATKAQPKEMLPLVDKPIIQYGVEEAVASGVDNIILVTGRGKNAIEDHFDVSVELETFLEARGKRELLDEIRKISNMINFAYVRQGEPLGLGHAVLVDARARRRRAVRRHPGRRRDRRRPAGDQADDRRVRAASTARCSPSNACRATKSRATASSPSSRTRDCGAGIYRVRDLVEKPPRDEAPSDLAIIGRYILTPDIFPALAATKSDRTGEIQLTNGLRELLEVAADLRVRGQRRPPRHRQQARIPEGGRLFRAAAARSGRQVLGVSGVARSRSVSAGKR